MVTLQDLTKLDIGVRPAGLGTLYYARLSEVANLPTPITNPTTFKEKVVIPSTSPITFKLPTEGWRKIYTTSEKGNLVVKGSEEKDTVGGMATVTFQLPNDGATVTGLMQELQEDEFVFLVLDGLCQTGQLRLMGGYCRSANVKFETNSGTTSQDARTTTLTIDYPAIPYFYEGVVTLPTTP